MNEYINEYAFADSYLADGDIVLWRGKPEKGITFGGGDLFTTVFGIFWLSFVVFWILSAASTGAPFPMILFGFPFLLIGVYLVGGRVIISEAMKSKTAYVITDKAIIKKCGRRVDVLYSRDNYSLQVYSHRNGTTTFVFDTHIVTHRVNHTPQTKKITLDNVRDAAGVNRALAEMSRT